MEGGADMAWEMSFIPVFALHVASQDERLVTMEACDGLMTFRSECVAKKNPREVFRNS